jgi:hypothetical protein
MVVQVEDALQLFANSRSLTVVKKLNSGKAERTGIGDEKWYLVDVHDVDGQMNIVMVGKGVMRNQSNVADNVGRGMICGLPFQGSKTRTEDTFSSFNVLLVDWTIANMIDGVVHEFPATGMHDDVLHTLCKDGIFVLSFVNCLAFPATVEIMDQNLVRVSFCHRA